jgi:hypothetical protein
MSDGFYLGLTPFSLFTVGFVSSGASSPEWVKPTTEGGGLEFRMFVCSFLWFGLCYVSCFVLIVHCFCEILST